MNSTLRKLLIALVIIAGIIGIGYGLYIIYNFVLHDATSKIRQGVSEGVGKGIGGALNPLSWFKK